MKTAGVSSESLALLTESLVRPMLRMVILVPLHTVPVVEDSTLPKLIEPAGMVWISGRPPMPSSLTIAGLLTLLRRSLWVMASLTAVRPLVRGS